MFIGWINEMIVRYDIMREHGASGTGVDRWFCAVSCWDMSWGGRLEEGLEIWIGNV